MKPIRVHGNKWDEYNEIDVDTWDEGTAPAYKLWPTEGDLTALLDADMFPYIVGYCQSEDQWFKALMKANEKGLKTNSRKYFRFLSKLPECQSAIDHCDSLVNEWIVGAGADSAKLYLTEGKGNYRYWYAFSKEYKGTRKKTKPPFFELIKWHLKTKHNAIVATDCEADDLMAIEQYQRNQLLVLEGAEQGSKEAKFFSNTVIVTKDKDLRMIPGWHSNPDLNKGEKFWVDVMGELEPHYKSTASGGKTLSDLKGTGLIWFYAQMIIGDKVDNYDGIFGYGPSKALDTLSLCTTVQEMHEVTKDLYRHKFGEKPFRHKTWTGKTITVTWEDMFCQMGRLAWMQTKPNEIFMKKHKLPKPKKWGCPYEDSKPSFTRH